MPRNGADYTRANICDFELPPPGTRKYYLLNSCMVIAIKYGKPTRMLITDFTPNQHLIGSNYDVDQPLYYANKDVTSNQIFQATCDVNDFSVFLKTYGRINESSLQLKGNFTNTSGDFIFARVYLSVKQYNGALDGWIEDIELLSKDVMDVNDDIYRKYFKLAGTSLLQFSQILRKKFHRDICEKYSGGAYQKGPEPERYIEPQYENNGKTVGDVANIYTQGSSPMSYEQNETFLVKHETDLKRPDSFGYQNHTKRLKISNNSISIRKLNEIEILDKTTYSVTGYLIAMEPYPSVCRKVGRTLKLPPVKLHITEDKNNMRDGDDILVMSFDTEEEILGFFEVRHIEELFVYESFFKDKIDFLISCENVPMTFQVQRKKIALGTGDRNKSGIFRLGWELVDMTIDELTGKYSKCT